MGKGIDRRGGIKEGRGGQEKEGAKGREEKGNGMRNLPPRSFLKVGDLLDTLEILSVDGACLSYRHQSRPFSGSPGPHFLVGDAEPVESQSWVRSVCARSISAWRRQGGALWIDSVATEVGKIPTFKYFSLNIKIQLLEEE